MKLYLQTYCSNEHWNPCAPVVVTEIDDTQLQQLREVCAELVRLKKYEADAILVRGQIERWDGGFYEDGEPFDGDCDRVEWGLRTDLDRIEVTQDSFMFQAYVDEAPDLLTTERVRFDQIDLFTTPPWER